MPSKLQQKFTAKATYDFAVDGGAQGDIGLGENLPDNAIVTAIMVDEVTPLTSGGSATVTLEAGLGADSPGALYTPLTFDGGHVPGANFITVLAGVTAKTTVGGAELSMTIATADLTAGKLVFYVEYVISE